MAAQEGKKEKESFPVRLARGTVEYYIREGKIISLPLDLPDYLKKPASVFVSIKKGSALRGCIGTTSPTQKTAAEEIIHNAIHSATNDPRFMMVEADELPDLVYSVDILEAPEEIPDESFLDPREYGVIVRAGVKGGLLLPDLEGIDTISEQVDIARRKGGISEDEPVKLYRFKVKRYY